MCQLCLFVYRFAFWMLDVFIRLITHRWSQFRCYTTMHIAHWSKATSRLVSVIELLQIQCLATAYFNWIYRFSLHFQIYSLAWFRPKRYGDFENRCSVIEQTRISNNMSLIIHVYLRDLSVHRRFDIVCQRYIEQKCVHVQLWSIFPHWFSHLPRFSSFISVVFNFHSNFIILIVSFESLKQ